MAKTVAVVIGRFQCLHNGHVELFKKAVEVANEFCVFIGSADSPLTQDNPFSYEDRARVIDSIFYRIATDKAYPFIRPLYDDLYDDAAWFKQIRESLKLTYPGADKFILVGSKKDDTWYLDHFPEMEYVNVPQLGGWQDKGISPVINATFIRGLLYNASNCGEEYISSLIGNLVPKETVKLVTSKQGWEAIEAAKADYQFHKDYKKKFDGYPFGQPTFVTTDAFVYCMGHVLMVKRKFLPGKGLWALPGGFLNTDELVADGIVRELKEETGLDLDSKSMKLVKVFDHPKRSKRGRIITHCGLFHLHNTKKLPRVRGSDDAERAKWIPIGDVANSNSFEDHCSLIRAMMRSV